MKNLIIFMYLSLLLIFQIANYHAVPLYPSSSEDNPNEVLSWYHLLKKFEQTRDRHYYNQRPANHYYKRFTNNEYLLPERQRRFGNTKYGRSLSME